MCRVAIWGVAEDVTGMVGNDVEDDANPLLVGGLNKVAKLRACPKMRVNVEKILDAVAVVARGLECNLAEDRAYPQGSDAEAFQISELTLEPFQGSTLPCAAGTEPRIIINLSRVILFIKSRRPRGYRTTVVVTMAATLVAIGESIDQ